MDIASGMSGLAQDLLGKEQSAEAAEVLEAELLALTREEDQDPRVLAGKHHELGRLWHKALHRVDRALFHAQRAFELDPDRRDALNDARSLFLSLGDEPDAIRLIDWELRRLGDRGDPQRRAQLLTELAGLLRVSGDVADAAERLEQALRCLPGDVHISEALAEAYASGLVSSENTLARQRAVELFLSLARRCRKDDPQGALTFLRRAYGVDPREGAAFAELVEHLSRHERWEDLAQLYDQQSQLAQDPEAHAELVILRAVLLHDKLGKQEPCRRAYESLLAQGGLTQRQREQAQEHLSALYQADGDYASLSALWETQLDSYLAEPEKLKGALLRLATLYGERLGQRDRAAEVLHRVLSLSPDHPEALARYAAHFQAKRDWRGLADLCEFNVETAREQQADPASIVRRLEELAQVAGERLGDTDRALKAFGQILELEPRNPKALEAVRRLEARTRMWESLVGVLEKEAASAPGPRERADAQKRIAQVYRERQVDPRRAIALYEEALTLLPGDAQALKALTDLYEREGDDAGLCRTLRRTLESDREARRETNPREWPTAQRSERLTLLRRLAGLYDTRTSDVDGVVFATTAILEMLPGDREALGRLERMLERHDDVEKLEQTLEYHATVATGPAERVKVLSKLARIAARRDDALSSMTRWEKVLAVSPSEPDALSALGVLYERHGRPILLAKILEQSLKLDCAAMQGKGNEGAPAVLRAVELKRYARVVEKDVGDLPRAISAWRQVLEILPRDREAMDALARLLEARGDWRDLCELLARKAELYRTDDRRAAVELTLFRATLLEERLGSPGEAASALEVLLDHIDPKNLIAHAALKRLYQARGEIEATLRIAERELYLTSDTEARHTRLLAIGALCRDRDDPYRALQAYERILAQAPRHGAALRAAAELYASIGHFAEHARMLEILAEEEPAPLERRSLYLRLAEVWAERLLDPRTAFGWYRRTQREVGDATTFAELRRAAEKNGYWSELAEVHEDERSRLGAGSRAPDPARFVALCRDLAGILALRLGAPLRALLVLEDAVRYAPEDGGLLEEAERICAGCHGRDEWRALFAIYETALERTVDPAARVRLFEKRAWIMSEHLGDPSGAEDELLGAFALMPEHPPLYDAILRLCPRTSHWEHAVTIDTTLFERARDPRLRLAIKRRIAQTIEGRLGDRVRAFRVHLEAFALDPEDAGTTAELWRLGKAILAEVSPPSSDGVVIIESTQPARESTQELTLGDVLAEGGIVETQAVRGDSTIPLSLADLMPRVRPPPRPRSPKPFKSPWEELAAAYESLPAKDAATKLSWLTHAAEVWEKGAGDLGRAFDTLARALDVAPGSPEPQERLRRLADEHNAWDRLVELYLGAAERARSTEQAVELFREAAAIEEKSGRQRAAELLYIRVLGIRPGDAQARARLEELFRREERWVELCASLEERTDLRQSSGAPESERPGLLLLLADLYGGKLHKPYEAISTLERLLDAAPDHQAALTRLCELYGSVGRWAKVAQILARLVDLAEGSQEARDLRHRLAEVYEKGLKLPDRALEVYQSLCAAFPEDELAQVELSRVLEAGGRWADLAEVLRERARLCAAPADRAGLLRRRAEVLLDWLDDADQAVTCLEQARSLVSPGPRGPGEPHDDALCEPLIAALVRADRTREAAILLEERISALEGEVAPDELATLLLRLASLCEPLGDREGARAALERALVLVPEHPDVLAALSRLARETTNPRALADVLLREAGRAADVGTRVATLLEAADTLEGRVGDTSAAKDALRAVLELDPGNAQATWSLAALCAQLGELGTAETLLSTRLSEELDPDERARVLFELAALARRAGDVQVAEHRLLEALGAKPDHLPAVLLRAEDLGQAERWEELAAFLAETIPRLHQPKGAVELGAVRSESEPASSPGEAHAALDRFLARAYEKLGRDDEGYALLLEADRRHRNDLPTKLALGENRYRAHRYREAALHLGVLAEHPRARQHAAEVAQGLYHAALSEIRALRPERAPALYEAALRLDPSHTLSLHALAETEMESGNVARAADLLERQAHATKDPAERLRLFEALGDLALRTLDDHARARACYEAAAQAESPLQARHVPLLEKLMAEQLGDPLAHAKTAELVAAFTVYAPARAAMLCLAATAYRQGGDPGRAQVAARRATDLCPTDENALALASELMLSAGDAAAAAELLSRTLDLLPRKGNATSLGAELWRRLGEARQALGDRQGAVVAYERAVAADSDSDAALVARRTLVEIHKAQDERADAVLSHLRALVIADPQGNEILALARALARQTAAGAVDEDGARATLELAATLGLHLSEKDRGFLDRHPPRVLCADETYPDAIDEDDRATLIADADDTPLAEALGLVWEAAGLVFPDATHALEQRGIKDAERVPAVARDPAALIYPQVARALSAQATVLWSWKAQENDVTIVCASTPLVLLGPRLLALEGTTDAELRFVLGRVVEHARPSRVAALGLLPGRFELLVAALVRAFVPTSTWLPAGVSRTDADAEAARLEKTLPRPLREKIKALLAAHPPESLDPARYQAACARAADRAGLLVSGDINVAMRLVGGVDKGRHLVALAVKERYLQVRAKLGIGVR